MAPAKQQQDIYVRLIYAAIAAVLLAGLYISFNKRIVSDELESLTAASFIGNGQVPYRDFWQIHTPLFYYFLTPLTALFKTMNVFYAARFFSFLLLLLNGYFLFLLAKRLFSGKAAIFSAFGYFTCIPVLKTMLEVRPDTLVITFANLSLILLLSARWPAARSFFAAGLMAGFGFLSKQSAVFFVLAVSVFFIIRLLARPDRFWDQDLFSRKRFNIRNYGLFFAGVFLPVVFVYLFLSAQGALELFLKHAVKNDFLNAFMIKDVESIHWSPWFFMKEMFRGNFMLFLSAAALPFYLAADRHKITLRTVNAFILLFSLAVVSYCVLFSILHPWRQEFLFFCQYLALLAGPVLAWLYDRLTGVVSSRRGPILGMAAGSILLLLICLPPIRHTLKAERYILARELQKYDLILSLTNDDDQCYSVFPCPFRPSAYYYRIAAIHVESRTLSAQMDDSLMEEFLRGRFVVILPYPRYESLPHFFSFLNSNYVLEEYPFYIPGQIFKRGKPAAAFNIPVDGYYQIKDWRGVVIDGNPLAGSSVYLKKGGHHVELPDKIRDRRLVYDFPANKRKTP